MTIKKILKGLQGGSTGEIGKAKYPKNLYSDSSKYLKVVKFLKFPPPPPLN